MTIYLDDDSADHVLVKLLKKDGHGVIVPADVNNQGAKDPAHLILCLQNQHVLLTRNYGDFRLLHDLVRLSGGHHPGIMAVRRDNDPTRDMTVKGIARAIRNLLKANIPIADEFHLLNQWR